MKKFLILAIFIFCTSLVSITVSAENEHNHDSVGMEQAFDNLMVSQFNDEINKAVENFYKKESVRINYNWFDKGYDVVEVSQSEKGRKLSHPFVIKFTVLSYDDKKPIGTDTITFGVSPTIENKDLNKKSIAAVNVELLNFQHNKPTKEEN
ncbi:DUF3888 domain-containing protein [Bacillus sp. V3B]|uniref:DUF3888 domain-containing protein n=1 Tax=Bacillus sp. V3B TaxID=2804915 RepID=UPI00210A345E|nr:DUF3888 domain-containing protein [Bacillus sp. V3B]MCQ6275949.1 DUF3888 domain-containing protein [Bacillus sp. V3B]